MHLVALATGTVEVGERTELRVRDSGAGVQTDAEAALRFRVTVQGRRLSLSLSLSPRVTAFSWANDARSVLASFPGSLAVGWRERHFGIFLSQDGSYGRENFATLRYPSIDALPGAPPGQPTTPSPLPTLPGASSVGYVASRSALSAYQIPSSRWLVTEAASFDVSGGATPTDRAFVPLQYGPRLALALDHRATRRDRIGAGADASFTHFTTGVDIALSTVVLRYVREVGRGTSVGFGAGPAGAAFRTEPQGYYVRAYANAELTVAHHRGFLGNKLDLDGIVRFAPVVDRIAATVDPRLSAALGATYTTRSWALRGQTSFVQSVLSGPAQLTGFGLEATLRLPLTRAVGIDCGSRVAVQSFQGLLFTSYGFFLGLDLAPAMLHFRTP